MPKIGLKLSKSDSKSQILSLKKAKFPKKFKIPKNRTKIVQNFKKLQNLRQDRPKNLYFNIKNFLDYALRLHI